MTPSLDIDALILKRLDAFEAKIDTIKDAQEVQNRAINERLDLSNRSVNERIMLLADSLHKEGNVAHKLILDVSSSMDRNTEETAKISRALFGDGSENSGAIDKLRELWRREEENSKFRELERQRLRELWDDKLRRDGDAIERAEERKDWRRSKIYLWTGVIGVGLTSFIREIVAFFHPR